MLDIRPEVGRLVTEIFRHELKTITFMSNLINVFVGVTLVTEIYINVRHGTQKV
jgi:hypothetical protein